MDGSYGNPTWQRHAIDEHAGDNLRWLWPGYIPYGRVTVMEGSRGSGKSLVAVEVAARLTRGRPMPDGTPCQPASVVLLSSDGLVETVVPRLEKAGADLQRVTLLESTPLRQIVLPRDVILLTQHINAIRAKLLIVDPLASFLDADIDPSCQEEVEIATAPLDLLAVASGIAIITVRRRLVEYTADDLRFSAWN